MRLLRDVSALAMRSRFALLLACIACFAAVAEVRITDAQSTAPPAADAARLTSNPQAPPNADEPPVIPIGLDAYRQWERWPYQRIGVRAYLRSTYDRSGGNEGADASHFLYQLADDFNVALDVAGPGVFYFARYNHWHGSPWHYEVDGVDHLIRETSTATPTQSPSENRPQRGGQSPFVPKTPQKGTVPDDSRIGSKPVEGSTFLPAELFPSPLAETWSATRGADLTWAPIPFKRRSAWRTHARTTARGITFINSMLAGRSCRSRSALGRPHAAGWRRGALARARGKRSRSAARHARWPAA